MVERIMPAKEQTAQEIKTLVENIEATSGTVVDIDGGKYKPNMRKHIKSYDKLTNVANLTPSFIGGTEDYIIFRGGSSQWTVVNKHTKDYTVLQLNSISTTFNNGNFQTINYNQMHMKHASGTCVQSGNYIYTAFSYNNVGYVSSFDTSLFKSSRDGSSVAYSSTLDPNIIVTIGSANATDFNATQAKFAKTRKYVIMYNYVSRRILYFENNGIRMTTTNPPSEFTMYGVNIGNGTFINNISYITDAEDEDEDIVLMIGSTQSGTQFICKYNIATSEILSYVINGDMLHTTLVSKGCTYDKDGIMIIRTASNGNKVVKLDKQTLVTTGVIPSMNSGAIGQYSHLLEIRDNGDFVFVDPIMVSQPAMSTFLPVGLELRSLHAEILNFETGKSDLLSKILFDVSEYTTSISAYVYTMFDEYSDKIYLGSIYADIGINIGKIVDVIDSYEVVE